MSNTLDNIQRDIALAELCVAFATGGDVEAAAAKLKPYIDGATDFICRILGNAVVELRRKHPEAFDAVLTGAKSLMLALGLDAILDADGVIEAMRYMDRSEAGDVDLTELTSLYESARAHEFTGDWRAIKLELDRVMLSNILLWYGAGRYSTLVNALIADIKALSDDEIEHLSAVDTNFLRRPQA